MNTKLNPSMPTSEAKKAYIKHEAERVRFNIARIGSEGVCAHCKYQDVCSYSTTSPCCAMSRSCCDGYERTYTYDKISVTKMEYKFEYQDEKDRK